MYEEVYEKDNFSINGLKWIIKKPVKESYKIREKYKYFKYFKSYYFKKKPVFS